MIGKILNDRYEILEEIGKGGLANVYKARCVLLNRIVAIKILREDLDSSEEFLRRFNAEAQAAAALDHPNIVSIFDVGIHDNRHYITMEYVNGKTLKEYIIEKGSLDFNEALNIAWQIADALTAAHNKNIVHRDIKPHNILITPDGDIKVTDFGIARFGTEKTLSNDKDILGSVHYISPEQAKGLEVDNRSDIYSLGVVLYEMLTGVVPFDGDNPVSVAMMQIENAPSDISSYVPDIPDSCQQVVFKAMTKDPDRRYQTADAMKMDIMNILNGREPLSETTIMQDNWKSESGVIHFNDDNNVTKTSTKVTMIILAAITSFVIVIGGYLVVKFLNSPKDIINDVMYSPSEKIEIPSLVGKKIDEAKSICEDAGLKLVIDDEVESDTKEPGTVISQSPTAGTNGSKDRTIRVIVAKEANYFELKDYTGQNYEIVQKRLLKLGLKISIKFEESDKPEGEIVKHVPASGEKVKNGDVITLYVSKAEEDELIEVPDLVGKTFAQAKSLLAKSNLVLGETVGKDKPADDDIVIEQSIPAGSKVAENCSVALTFKNDEPDPEDEDPENNKEDKTEETKNETTTKKDNKEETKKTETKKENKEDKPVVTKPSVPSATTKTPVPEAPQNQGGTVPDASASPETSQGNEHTTENTKQPTATDTAIGTNSHSAGSGEITQPEVTPNE